MDNRHRSVSYWLIRIACLAVLLSPVRTYAANEATARENQSILQKGLTVYEIDQELIRLQTNESTLLQSIADSETELAAKVSASEQTRLHAAKVLRAYYMGDRDVVWMLLFSIRSLSDALTSMEYLTAIYRHDVTQLSRYTEDQKQIQATRTKLVSAHSDLVGLRNRYLNQKDQLVALQKELDKELAAQTEAQKQQDVKKQIEDLTKDWQSKGVPLFKTYFQALAAAMKQLPELAAAGGAKNTNFIINGFSYTFQITDTELNAFLRKKNELFNNMTFTFTDKNVIAEGKQDNIAITIKGHYTLHAVQDNYIIRFVVDELTFNGFKLPQTTIEELEKQFDLGIYPQSMASFLQLTGMTMVPGKLSIQLKFKL
jgi:hypothetical protein